MIYIEAPQISEFQSSGLFLAGGITGCPDWQAKILQGLSETSMLVMNPRRANFPIHDPTAAQTQIQWEHDHLRKATAVLFWFPCETLCPIVLYELGAWSMTDKPLFVGIHPRYERRRDVEIQTALARPDIQTVYDLSDLAHQVILWWNAPILKLTI